MVLLFAALLCCILIPVQTKAEEPIPDMSIDEGVESWLEEIDWSAWEAELMKLPEEVRTLLGGIGTRDMTKRIAETGETGLNLFNEDGMSNALSDLFKTELKAAAGFFALLIGVILIGGACTALAGDKNAQVADAAGMVCRCVLLLIVLSTLLTLARATQSCIERIGSFMEVAAPVLMTLLAAVGGTASAGVFQPAMSMLCTTVTGVIEYAIIPLALCGGVLAVVDGLSKQKRVSEMAGLIQSAAKWIVGIMTTVYIAATSIGGMTAAAFDGVSVRAAKYAAGSMVPMFGSLVSGSFDTMLGCAALVKNAVGLTAILLTVAVIVLPMLRLLAYQLLLWLSAAIAQLLSGARQAAMLKSGVSMIGSLLSACTAMALMLIVTLGLILGLGNAGYL